MNKVKKSPYRLIGGNTIKTQPDERGNFYSVKVNELGVRIIHLHLMETPPPRLLGNILPKARVFVVYRNRQKHLFKKNNSYGFNEHILRTATMFDHVELIDDFGIYKIPRELILSSGTYLDFKSVGYEKQIFLSLDIIEKHKFTLDGKAD